MALDYQSIAQALGVTVESVQAAHREMLGSREVQVYLEKYGRSRFLEMGLLIGWILCALHFSERNEDAE